MKTKIMGNKETLVAWAVIADLITAEMERRSDGGLFAASVLAIEGLRASADALKTATREETAGGLRGEFEAKEALRDGKAAFELLAAKMRRVFPA